MPTLPADCEGKLNPRHKSLAQTDFFFFVQKSGESDALTLPRLKAPQNLSSRFGFEGKLKRRRVSQLMTAVTLTHDLPTQPVASG